MKFIGAFVSFCFCIFSSFLLCACITVVMRNKIITEINVVLLNYFEDRSQQKIFFLSVSCFNMKKKEVLPVSIYLDTASSHFSLKSSFCTCPCGLQFVIFVKLFSFFFVQCCIVSNFSYQWIFFKNI